MDTSWNDDDVASLIEFTGNHERFGLGYKPTRTDVRRISLEMRGRSMGHLQRPQMKGIPLCHINKSFFSTSWMCEGRVAMIHDEVPHEQSNWVRLCPSKFKLEN